MTTSPVLSVVVPTYNDVDVLPRCLASLQVQCIDASWMQVVVVDDGSTDATPAFLAGIDDAHVCVIRGRHRGVSAARNAGVEASTGSFVMFLDSDDEALPHLFRRLEPHIGDRTLQVGVVSWGHLAVRHDHPVIAVLPKAPSTPFGDQVAAVWLAGSFAVRRDVLLEVGGYDTALRHSENTDLGIRLVAHCLANELEVRSVPETLMRRHDHPTRSYDAARLEAAAHLLAKYPEEFRRAPKAHADYLAVAGVNAARIGDLRQARRYFRRAVGVRPAAPRHLARYVASVVPSLARRRWTMTPGAAT